MTPSSSIDLLDSADGLASNMIWFYLFFNNTRLIAQPMIPEVWGRGALRLRAITCFVFGAKLNFDFSLYLLACAVIFDAK